MSVKCVTRLNKANYFFFNTIEREANESTDPCIELYYPNQHLHFFSEVLPQSLFGCPF